MKSTNKYSKNHFTISVEQIDKLQLFFIVGRIRSGTTLLNNVLNAHDQIFIPQESPFILYLFNKYSKESSWTKSKLNQFYTDIWLEHRLTQFWELNQEHLLLKNSIVNLGNKATFERLCKLIIWFQARRHNKSPRFIGDKNPSYASYLDTLNKLFPSAKFIMLIRDPRSNMLSCKKVSFDSNHPATLATRWKKSFYNIQRFKKSSRNNSQIVFFESLIKNPEVSLKRVSKTLGIEYNKDLMEFHNSSKELKSWKHFYLRPFEVSKVSNWISEITDRELETVEWITRKEIHDIDYDIIGKEVLSLRIKAFYISRIFIGILLNILESTIYYLPIKIKSKIIDIYRIKTKTIIRNNNG